MAHPVSQDRAAHEPSQSSLSRPSGEHPLREAFQHNPERLKQSLLTDRTLRRDPPLRRGSMTCRHRQRVIEVLLEVHGPHCWLCNKQIVDEKPTLDHIVPRSKGGRNAIANLRLAHHDCNQLRGDGPIPELLLTEQWALQGEPA